MAAIEVAVLESMDLAQAADVHAAWVRSGGPSFDDWVLTRGVQSFLGGLGASDRRKDVSTRVTATPAGAQVKGADGPDWVLACVLLEVRAVAKAEARTGFGHCERMVWDPSGRWMIAEGAPAAFAPSTWPGSVAAVEAGWRPWVEAGVSR